MSLQSGHKLGPYEILAPAGAGGMGEVYKARDTRLDRIVAIKILPEKLSSQPQLVARFEQEAKAISRLNHPNICTLYDVGHETGTRFLVMEFLEGESLSDRIKRGALPTMEALDISAQIADALDSAHRRKLIHRDLKPGNVMLTRAGPKLLDFGLAKLERDGALVEGISGVTHTTPLTGEGTIIGTIQYMSPEQLEGKEADERSDIFAFGSTVYEMITGQKAFEGRSQASLIAAILERDPTPPSELKPMTPPALDRLIKKCLAKDPDDRWQSARDLGDELRWIAQSGSQAGTPLTVTHKRRVRFRLAWAVAAVMFAFAVVFAYLWFSHEEPEQLTTRFKIGGDRLVNIWSPAISPNGRYIAFKARDTANTEGLWARAIDELEARHIHAAPGSRVPFWSPDSRFLCFVDTRGELKKVSIDGGPAQILASKEGIADGSWGKSGIILLDGGFRDSIRQVPAGGGMVTAATSINREKNEVYHSWPWFLPDGKHFLYLAALDSTLSGVAGSPRRYRLKVAELGKTESLDLFEVDSRVIYSEPGYLLYLRGNVLTARRFDADSHKLLSDPFPIHDDIVADRTIGRANFSCSDNGTLVYEVAGESSGTEIAWLDRQGNLLEVVREKGLYGGVELSPEETRIAYSSQDGLTIPYDIWIHNLQRNVATKLTFDPLPEISPVWHPNGRVLFYNAGLFPSTTTYKRRADGTGNPEPAISAFSGKSHWITDIYSDGQYACYCMMEGDPKLYIAELSYDAEPRLITDESSIEWAAEVSPNGKFLAYLGDEGAEATDILFVRKLDDEGGRWQISPGEVGSMRWRKDGKELYYVTWSGDVTAVRVNTEPEFSLGGSEYLFNVSLSWPADPRSIFDVDSTGQRFLFNRVAESLSRQQLTIVQNWHAEFADK